MSEVVSRRYGDERFYSVLMTSFAAVALLLAAVGLYGVVGYTVAQRTHEIAVRKALGARRPEVVSMVLRQGARPVFAGLGIGLAIAAYYSGVLVELLYDTDPTDPWMFVGASVILAIVVLFALFVPATRASRIDPMGVLKRG